VIFLTSAGRIEFASPTARRLLQTYFGTVYSAELPLRLADWVESGAKVLVHRHDPHRLTVDRSGDFLLLVETRDELGLTTRERQILAWVARGKTNPQIAETLSVAPSTVRKHLEHVYEKLGVRSRTAAVTRFLGVLERDESMDR